MIGTIIKLAFVVIVVLVLLNIFAPQQAEKVLDSVSQSTSLDKDTLQKNLDKATEFTKDTVNEATDTIKDKIEENK